MDNKKFIDLCLNQVIKHYTHIEETIISKEDIYVVWSCKTLQNNKALLSTNVVDGMYYEITYNGDKKEMYFDAYKKVINVKVEVK